MPSALAALVKLLKSTTVVKVRKRSVGIFNIALTPFQLSTWSRFQDLNLIPRFQYAASLAARPGKQIICAQSPQIQAGLTLLHHNAAHFASNYSTPWGSQY